MYVHVEREDYVGRVELATRSGNRGFKGLILRVQHESEDGPTQGATPGSEGAAPGATQEPEWVK